jgi:hypothetical protein
MMRLRNFCKHAPRGCMLARIFTVSQGAIRGDREAVLLAPG